MKIVPRPTGRNYVKTYGYENNGNVYTLDRWNNCNHVPFAQVPWYVQEAILSGEGIDVTEAQKQKIAASL